MTGFGKSEIAIDGRKLRVEIKTVNHRFLDINIREPRFMMFLEEDVRKFLKQSLNRGRVEVFINYSSERADAKKVITDMSLLNAYLNAAKEICDKTGVEDDLTVSQLMRLPDAVTYEDENSDQDALRELLFTNLKAAIKELSDAREKEGAQLKKDVYERLDTILSYVETISGKEHVIVDEYKKKLHDRIADILDGAEVDEQKLAQEVAFYADRCNITEELVRLRSHVKQMKASGEQTTPQGRNMDFIVQELNREFNTIGSKTQDAEILKMVIAGKGEVEKIREQIQNIE
ncbi:MAG: YicC/YloC family endoribonuclease [Christensenella sp.]|uniref:YicC/YloC family endoribonuclease n=1 Tax=Christensenella sp. TaxID=1935934 RepID=UPI002B203305|nr:YicC/YloC family endoribonuclease [Christensenella sp.]MEA5002727.1 YicC/YloC family endoribonuclease [Christensenella sp.]